MSKLRVGILGCGMMSGAHARRWKASDKVEIVALCDCDEAKIKSLLDRRLDDYSPIPTFYTDAADMYAKANLDAVAIVTPHSLHYEQAVQALDAGCNVVLEKPMVTRTDNACKLAEKVEQSGKVLVVCYNTSFTPPFVYLRDTIRNKTLGNLEMVNGYLSQGWKKATEGSWRQKLNVSGGGQAFDSGCHLMNSLCWSVESRVAEVFAVMDNQGTEVDINSCITARFENGVIASVAISGNCPDDGCHMVFIFDGGRVEIDGWEGKWIRVHVPGQEVTEPELPAGSDNPNDNLVEAILGREEPRVTAQNGIIQCELMEAVYESAKTGQPARPAGQKLGEFLSTSNIQHPTSNSQV